MIERFKKFARRIWQDFSRGRPGKRFQGRYYRRQQDSRGRFGVRRVFNLTLGILLVAASAVGGLLPVLGWGTAIIGFALIAGEVLAAARLLDKTELRLRQFLQFVRFTWDHSWAGKVLVTGVTGLAVAAFVYLMYVSLFVL